MEIIDNRVVKSVKFSELKYGETFVLADYEHSYIYMKIPTSCRNDGDAICLSTGYVIKADPDKSVNIVHTKLIVEE